MDKVTDIRRRMDFGHCAQGTAVLGEKCRQVHIVERSAHSRKVNQELGQGRIVELFVAEIEATQNLVNAILADSVVTPR